MMMSTPTTAHEYSITTDEGYRRRIILQHPVPEEEVVNLREDEIDEYVVQNYPNGASIKFENTGVVKIFCRDTGTQLLVNIVGS